MNIPSKAALLAGLLALAPGAFAHMKDGHKHTVDEKVAKLTRELNLTADQQATLRAVLEEQKQRKEDADTDQERLAVHEETRARVRGLLSADQKAKYDRMKDVFPKTGKPAVPEAVPEEKAY